VTKGRKTPKLVRRRDREHALPVRWSSEAELDLREIVTYLLYESPEAARTVLVNLKNGAAALQDFPRRGRVVPELKRIGINDWREIIIRPYRLLYTVGAGGVEIDAVLDSRRDIEALLHGRIVNQFRWT